MALKGNSRKTYKTMRGKMVDMDLLQARNELTPAVGNARVNARGDEIGPGGKIIKKREELMREYYETNNAIAHEEMPGRAPAPIQADEVVEEKPKANKQTRAQAKVEQAPKPTAKEAEEFGDDQEWIEDDNGNFVPKGE